LLVRGALSDYVLDSDLPDFQNAFPALLLHTIPNASHWVHAEEPELFYSYVIDFLKA